MTCFDSIARARAGLSLLFMVSLIGGFSRSASAQYWGYQEFRLDEVCSFTVREGRLVMDMRIDPAEIGRFSIRGPRGDTGSYRSGALNYSITHTFGPERAQADLKMRCQSFGMSMIYTVRGPNAFTVRYLQYDNRQNGVDEGWVALIVPAEGSSSETVELRAPDFATLCRAHPRETTQYLGPIFRALQAGSAFKVSPSFARQVLLERSSAPELRPRVLALLEKLDSADPKERAGAAHALDRLGPQAGEILASVDASVLTAQQQAEVEALLANSRAPTFKLAKDLLADRDFLIDCLYCTDEAVRSAVLKRLEALHGQPVEVSLKGDAHQQARAIERLREILDK